MKKELFKVLPGYEILKKLAKPAQMEDGSEVHNPEPMYLPMNDRPPTLQEQIKRVIRHELSRNVKNEGYETFEESNDFEIEDEDELIQPYRVVDMVEDFVDNEDKPEPDLDDQSNPDQEDKEVNEKEAQSEDLI